MIQVSKKSVFLLLISCAWIGFIIYGFAPHPYNGIVGYLTNSLDPLFDFFILFGLVLFGSKLNRQDLSIFVFLILSVFGLFACDFLFYLIVYIFKDSSQYGLVVSSVPFLLWIVMGMTFCLLIVEQKLLRWSSFLVVLSLILVGSIWFMYILFTFPEWKLNIHNYHGQYEELSAFLSLIFFGLVLILFVYAEKKGMQLLMVGNAVLMAGNFWIKYSYIVHLGSVHRLGEVFWLLGLGLMLAGVYGMNLSPATSLSECFRKTKAIKIQMVLWTFFIAFVGCLFFFICGLFFSIITQQVFVGLPFFIMTYSILLIIVSMLMGSYFEQPFKKLIQNIEIFMHHHDGEKIETEFAIEEFVYLQNFILASFRLEEDKTRAERALGAMARQIAHDIRSPLTALNTCLKYLPEIPSQQRTLMRNAADRINDIANNILYQNKEKTASAVRFCLIAPIVEMMISEKRLQLEGQKIQLQAEITQAGFTAFARLDPSELQRVLSNLINNAVEAMRADGGKIGVDLDVRGEQIILLVKDDGEGIPAERLNAVLEAGVSFKEQGTGLGLPHAKQVVESWEGRLQLYSVVGEGTTVEIILPVANPPSEFVFEIVLDPKRAIAILDDDESIHQAWDQRLEEFAATLNVYHFTAIEPLLRWQKEQKGSVQIFSDYDLYGEKQNGLDVLEQLAAHEWGCLVTSHYDEPEIVLRAEALGVSILPKNLLTHVPVRMIATIREELAGKTLYDAVLIEDNTVLRQGWAWAAEMEGKKLLTCASIAEFEKAVACIDIATPIYIDSDLGAGVRGEEYAKKLYERGFKTIYLTSGYPPEHFAPMPWIRAVVGKSPPF